MTRIASILWTGLSLISGPLIAAPANDVTMEIVATPSSASWWTPGHAFFCLQRPQPSDAALETCFAFYDGAEGQIVVGSPMLEAPFDRTPERAWPTLWAPTKAVTEAEFANFLSLVEATNNGSFPVTQQSIVGFVVEAEQRLGFAPAPAGASPAVHLRELYVRNLDRFTHSSGWFERRTNGDWAEFDGTNHFTFAQHAVDETDLTLFDGSRGIYVRLPLKGGFSRWSNNATTWENLYAVTPYVKGRAAYSAPVSDGDYFRIGPYPIPFQASEQTANLWAQLLVIPHVIGRNEDEYALNLFLEVDLTGIVTAIRLVEARELPKDNCGRDGVDNYVWQFDSVDLSIPESTRARLAVHGKVSTWSCATVPEFFNCQGCCGCFGIGGTKCDCVGVRDTKAKFLNLEQGFEVYSGITILQRGGRANIDVSEPRVVATGESLGTQFLNVLMFLHFLKSVFDDIYGEKPELLQIIPDSLKELRPRFNAAFVQRANGPWLRLAASISVTREQLNDAMDRAFGGRWRPIQPPQDDPNPPPTGPNPQPQDPDINRGYQRPTKAFLRVECPRLGESDLEACASKLGLSWETLPEN